MGYLYLLELVLPFFLFNAITKGRLDVFFSTYGTLVVFHPHLPFLIWGQCCNRIFPLFI